MYYIFNYINCILQKSYLIRMCLYLLSKNLFNLLALNILHNVCHFGKMKKFSGIPYTANGAQITSPFIFDFCLYAYFSIG